MPQRPPRPCGFPGCPALITTGTRCERHTVQRESNWPKYDKERPTSTGRGYGWRWQQARKRFLRSNSRCGVCGRTATVVDHIVPHRGSPALFWDRTNWQPLCVECHASKTARGR